MGIKILRPAGNISEPDTACTEKGLPERDELHGIRNTRLGIALRVDDRYHAPDLAGDRNKTEIAGTEIHGISKVAELDINIKSLGEQIDSVPIMPLKLEIITDISTEFLVITVIPDHADFIDQHNGPRRETPGTDLVHIKSDTTGDINSRIDRKTFPEGLESDLSQKRGLTGTFLAKDHDKLVRVAVTVDHDRKPDKKTDSRKKEKILQKNTSKTRIYLSKQQSYK